MRAFNMHEVDCAHCPFYHAFSEEELVILGDFAETREISGQCRIDAPVVIGDGTNVGYFPTTYKSRWCGRHPDFDI